MKRSTGPVWFLKVENGAKHAVRHGEVDQQADHPGQTPAGLRQREQVGDGVADARAGEDAEVKQSDRQHRASQSVKQADQHEGNNGLYVILVTPGEQKHIGSISIYHNLFLLDSLPFELSIEVFYLV